MPWAPSVVFLHRQILASHAPGCWDLEEDCWNHLPKRNYILTKISIDIRISQVGKNKTFQPPNFQVEDLSSPRPWERVTPNLGDPDENMFRQLGALLEPQAVLSPRGILASQRAVLSLFFSCQWLPQASPRRGVNASTPRSWQKYVNERSTEPALTKG